MSGQLYVQTDGVRSYAQIHDQVVTGLSRLMGDGAPEAAGVQTSHGTIASAVSTALSSVLGTRHGTMQTTATSGSTISELLKKAAQMYEQGDREGAENLTAAAETLEAQQGGGASTAAGSPAAGSPAVASPPAGSPPAAGGDQAGQMLGQIGQQVGQIVGGLMQPLAGIAQGLQQVPQQVMQGLQEAVGSPGDKRGVSGEREDERAAKLRERTEERPDTERLDTDAEPARETARPGDHAAGPAPGESTAAGRAPEPARPDGPSPAPTRPQAN